MTLQPEGEALRKAVKWISAERADHPEKSLDKLVEEAAVNFDLSPREEEFLGKFVREEAGK